ncbi:diguanylate cyclase [Vibrio crassostreae]|uniref:diguanylate cyclase n=1 Tax=Vibrio crassostreae TaxID=246167 RepID=UPI001B306C1B|nr:diguanylate cyclase [Vibrio crassostreae]
MLAALSTMVFSTVTISLNLSKDQNQGIRKIAMALIFISIGCFLKGLQGTISDFLSLVMSSCLFVLGFSMLGIGFCGFRGGRRKNYCRFLHSALLGFALVSYLTHTTPSLKLMMIVLSLTISAIMLAACLEFRKLKNDGDSERTVDVISTAFAVMSLSFFGRAVLVCQLDVIDSDVTNSILYQIPYFSWACCNVALVVGLIWLVSDRRETIINSSVYEDTLTPFFNRKILPSIPAKLIDSAREGDRKLAVLMCDIDNFKTINDTRGHLTGDLVIKNISELIMRNLRDSDIPVRYGGDEFLVFLPKTNLQQAIIVAERIRQAADAQDYSSQFDVKKRVALSIGVATAADEETLESLISKADRALYKAKMAGRNRVEIINPIFQN